MDLPTFFIREAEILHEFGSAQFETTLPAALLWHPLACPQLDTLVCHQFVLTEFVLVMDKVYETPKEQINAMVRDFIAMPGVELLHETDFSAVLSLWPERVSDFGDALVASAGIAIKGAVIVTFDAKFKSALKALGQAVYQA